VLEQGNVVEQGTHGSLLADPHGVYARFHRVQSNKGLGLVDDTKASALAAPQRRRRVAAGGERA
jgi:ATP-binding cassette subfamily B protein